MQNKNKAVVFVSAIVLALIAFLPSAYAAPASAFTEVAGPASIPVGHAEFCKTHRDDCQPNARVVDAVVLTEALWTQLLAVNAQVNGTVIPETDEDLYKVAEYWTYPDGYGDCEDIALEKRRELIASGWPVSTLLMTVVREANGNGHAVLTVRTDRGDLVLDNQEGLVELWSETPYHFVKRQSQANSGQWVDLVDDRATLVATK